MLHNYGANEMDRRRDVGKIYGVMFWMAILASALTSVVTIYVVLGWLGVIK